MTRRSERPIRLVWEGKGSRPAPPSGTCLAPRETRVACSEAGELHAGDNLKVLASLAERFAGTFTLAYLDPPFLTGRVHEMKTRRAGAKPDVQAAFDDRWSDRAAYLDALGERLERVRELLAPEGSVVVHVDPKTSHYVKVLCDEIFGDDAFASEIIWRYRRWPAKTPNFQNVHDVLLRYRKDPTRAARWNQLYEPLAASTVATWGTKKQRAVVDAETGRRLRSSSEEVESRGVPMGDVWEIGVVAPIARERTGYPTQKPEALLTRLIHSLTDPGDWVLDPYAGSGTTLAVAAREGRRFVGIDVGEAALATTRARLGLTSFTGAEPARILTRKALRTA